MKKGTALIGLAVALYGCQTESNMQWAQIGPGPTLEYSQAECKLGAMNVDRGMVAFGSPGFVVGAQVGNAVGNAMREQQFINQCMIMHGWKRVPAGPTPSVTTTSGTGQTSVADLIIAWGKANRSCTATEPPCADKKRIELELNARGFCYGTDNESPITAYWHVCPGAKS